MTKWIQTTLKARSFDGASNDKEGEIQLQARMFMEKELKEIADAEALYSYEATKEINSLIVGRAITGFSAFV